MLRIGLSGVPGSGKTTLSRSIAAKCRTITDLEHVELVNEYARRYISKHGPVTSIFEQYRILEKQLEWEDSVCGDDTVMITDSPVFLGFIYCCDLPKSNSKEVMFFNDIFKRMVKVNYPIARYDLIFHLSPCLKVIDDGIRKPEHLAPDWRTRADTMIRAMMDIFVPKRLVNISVMDLDERTDICLQEIKKEIGYYGPVTRRL